MQLTHIGTQAAALVGAAHLVLHFEMPPRGMRFLKHDQHNQDPNVPYSRTTAYVATGELLCLRCLSHAGTVLAKTQEIKPRFKQRQASQILTHAWRLLTHLLLGAHGIQSHILCKQTHH
jgi:hypothetical protein